MKKYFFLLIILSFLCTSLNYTKADSGYRLWLKYDLVSNEHLLNQYKKLIKASMIEGQSPAIEAAKNELEKGLKGLLGSAIPQVDIINESGVLLAGVYKTSTIFQKLDLKKDLKKIGDEGFIIKNTVIDGKVYDL